MRYGPKRKDVWPSCIFVRMISMGLETTQAAAEATPPRQASTATEVCLSPEERRRTVEADDDEEAQRIAALMQFH